MIDVLDIIQELIKKNNHDKPLNIIKFCWIPSHVGIRGNDLADTKAKHALGNNEPINYKFPQSDYIPKIKLYIRKKWQQRWDYKHNNERSIKLHDIIPTLKPFYVSDMSRRSEIVIHRLRIGHTRMTHKYLMEGGRVPHCNFCYDDTLTVAHIMIECQHFAGIRINKYRNIKDMKELFERVPLKNILGFLREANLYKDI